MKLGNIIHTMDGEVEEIKILQSTSSGTIYEGEHDTIIHEFMGSYRDKYNDDNYNIEIEKDIQDIINDSHYDSLTIKKLPGRVTIVSVLEYYLPAFYAPLLINGEGEGLRDYESKIIRDFIHDENLKDGHWNCCYLSDMVMFRKLHSLTKYGIEAADCQLFQYIKVKHIKD